LKLPEAVVKDCSPLFYRIMHFIGRFFYISILVFFALPILAQNKDGVVFRAGISSSIFHKNNSAMLIHNGSAGNTIGFDGLFYEGKLLIHPGIHFITFPRKYGKLKESFKNILSKTDSTYDFAFKLPIRLGVNLLDIGNVRLSGSVGFYGLYSPDGIEVTMNDIEKSYFVTGGWTVNFGLILKCISLNIDYDGSLCRPSPKGPMYFKSVSFTAGFFF
jgi:hypothetical protein